MKRSDKYTDDYIEQRYESQRPYYNTYYQPIGNHRKEKSKRIFLKAIITILILLIIFLVSCTLFLQEQM